jgi:hypothetical protein|tara:strand:+ start:3708 stop:4268 length:561 start_codon:yes stop_codon:yes gene_type:complete
MEEYEDDTSSIGDMESIEDILDEGWLNEFEFVETNYDKFYNTDNYKINIVSFFLQNNKIQHIGNEKYNLNVKNTLTDTELLKIVKTKAENKYTLHSILRYNIDIKPRELINFKNNLETQDKYRYMNRIKSVETVYFMPSIQMFSDLNTLYLFFEKKEISNSNTKKIRYTPVQNTKKTKKSYISLKK